MELIGASSGVLTAQSCDHLLHYDVKPNASSDIMIVSDIDFGDLLPYESQTSHF